MPRAATGAAGTAAGPPPKWLAALTPGAGSAGLAAGPAARPGPGQALRGQARRRGQRGRGIHGAEPDLVVVAAAPGRLLVVLVMASRTRTGDSAG